MATSKRFKCKFCGLELRAYLPWAKAPNSALLLGNLSQQHMNQLRPYLTRMEIEWTAARIRVKNSRMCHTSCEGPATSLLASLLFPKRMEGSEIISRGHDITPPLH
jgi:hypothetical protein